MVTRAVNNQAGDLELVSGQTPGQPPPCRSAWRRPTTGVWGSVKGLRGHVRERP